MSNHYHLIVETLDGNLAKGMRQLNGVYTQTSNRRHNRTGHLFQGRYKVILVDKESYLLELAGYVVLNSVRAKGMVRDIEDWQWSSYTAMISKIGVNIQSPCYLIPSSQPSPGGEKEILRGPLNIYAALIRHREVPAESMFPSH